MGASECRAGLRLALADLHRLAAEDAQVHSDPLASRPGPARLDLHCTSRRTPAVERIPTGVRINGRRRRGQQAGLTVATRQRNGRMGATKGSQPDTPIIVRLGVLRIGVLL